MYVLCYNAPLICISQIISPPTPFSGSYVSPFATAVWPRQVPLAKSYLYAARLCGSGGVPRYLWLCRCHLKANIYLPSQRQVECRLLDTAAGVIFLTELKNRALVHTYS